MTDNGCPSARRLEWPADGLSMVARNGRTNVVLATHAQVAATRAARAVGLLRHRALPVGQGLWIVPSRGVHTWGMRFAIDVIALDAHGTVIDLVEHMRPWRLRWPRRATVGVLELPAGTIGWSRTGPGDTIVFERVHRASSIVDGYAA